MPQLVAQLEALLFAAGRPMTVRQLAKLTAAKPKAITAALEALQQDLSEQQRGLALTQHEGRVQLVTHPQHGQLIEHFVKEEFTGPLSRAALETLAIIAYRGPIAKPAIDSIRGVNSAIMLRTLLIRGLVERTRSRTDARTFSYALAMDFVRHLGVTDIRQLPRYDEYHANEVISRFAQPGGGDSIEQTPDA